MENQNDEASSLILDSLEIHNFRAFEHLLIEKLGRVNLIVGKNNVGKTCVLEALQLYASLGSRDMIKEILHARGELAFIKDIKTLEGAEQHLFYGRKIAENLTDELIRIGTRKGVEESSGFLSTPYELGRRYILSAGVLLIDKNLNSYSNIEKIRYSFIPDKNMKNTMLFQLWNNIYLTDSEDEVIRILSIIEPRIRRIGFTDDLRENGNRVPMVRLTTSKTPFLLSSMGEGMNRLLGIALALANSADGFLLIDEIENGIHHSVQTDLWRLIFEGAEKMNVQIFATTHSMDCIEAFQEAATDEGVLISLRQKKKTPGHVISVIIDREELEIVTRERIEVR